jgi:hypothetical protein
MCVKLHAVNESMSKTYIKWQMNPQFMTTDPEATIQIQTQMLNMTKADLESGALLDWGLCADLSGGYAITELSGAELQGYLAKWSPRVQFDARQVVNVDQAAENLKSAAAAR